MFCRNPALNLGWLPFLEIPVFFTLKCNFMALQKQAITGATIGVLIGAAAALIYFTFQRAPKYRSMRMDGNIVRSLYNSNNFGRIEFNFKLNANREFELVAQAYATNGSEILTPTGLLTVLPETREISGSKTLVPYTLEHYNVASLRQLRDLINIIGTTNGRYFDLMPRDYVEIDPQQKNNVYYKIFPKEPGGGPINPPPGTDARTFQLNPSPPGRRW